MEPSTASTHTHTHTDTRGRTLVVLFGRGHTWSRGKVRGNHGGRWRLWCLCSLQETNGPTQPPKCLFLILTLLGLSAASRTYDQPLLKLLETLSSPSFYHARLCVSSPIIYSYFCQHFQIRLSISWSLFLFFLLDH